MNYQSDQLWQRIKDFSFDEPGAVFPFSKKLAKKQNWTEDLTARAIEEYRRFIYLCCILPTGASPSQTVDEVWHLHLTYTVNYWVKFCRETLHKDIHHHPSNGGSGEKVKHNNWYQDTIRSYRETFSEEPPGDIWPSPNPDFTMPHHNSVVTHKVFNKKFFFLLLVPFAIAAILYGQPIPFFLSGPHYLVFYSVFIVVTAFLVYKIREVRWQNFNQYVHTISDLNNYKLAFLIGGYKRYLLLCLSELIREEILVHKKKDIYLIDRAKARSSNVKIASDLATYERDSINYKSIQLLIWSKSNEDLKDLRELKARHADKANNILIGVLIAVFTLPRMIQGTLNNKPVTILGVFFFLSVIVFIVLYRSAFHYFAGKFFRENKALASNINDDIASRIIFSGVAGIAGIHMFSHLNTRHYDFNSDSGGGCSGSGCGSSCGGGGCGGCGGD